MLGRLAKELIIFKAFAALQKAMKLELYTDFRCCSLSEFNFGSHTSSIVVDKYFTQMPTMIAAPLFEIATEAFH